MTVKGDELGPGGVALVEEVVLGLEKMEKSEVVSSPKSSLKTLGDAEFGERSIALQSFDATQS